MHIAALATFSWVAGCSHSGATRYVPLVPNTALRIATLVMPSATYGGSGTVLPTGNVLTARHVFQDGSSDSYTIAVDGGGGPCSEGDWVLLANKQPPAEAVQLWHPMDPIPEGTTVVLLGRYPGRPSPRICFGAIPHGSSGSDAIIKIEMYGDEKATGGMSGGPVLAWDEPSKQWKLIGMTLGHSRNRFSQRIRWIVRRIDSDLLGQIENVALAHP